MLGSLCIGPNERPVRGHTTPGAARASARPRPQASGGPLAAGAAMDGHKDGTDGSYRQSGDEQDDECEQAHEVKSFSHRALPRSGKHCPKHSQSAETSKARVTISIGFAAFMAPNDALTLLRSASTRMSDRLTTVNRPVFRFLRFCMRADNCLVIEPGPPEKAENP